MESIELTPTQIDALASTMPSLRRAQGFGTTETPQPRGWWDDTTSAFAAQFQLDNTLVSALNAAGLTDASGALDPSRQINPYTYIRENWDDRRRQGAAQWIGMGLFDNATTPELVELQYQRLQNEAALRERGERSFVGSMLGSVAGAILDPTSYVGGRWALRGAGLVERVGRFAAQNAGTQALQELGLQSTQELRTARESFFNIGTAALIGGGLGGFSHGLMPNHPLHPDHPNNPLRLSNVDADGLRVRDVDGSVDTLSPQDLSAALAPDGADWLTAPSKVGGNIITNAVTYATPTGRAFQRVSQAARNVILRLLEPGGTMTNWHFEGRALPRNAESIKRDLMQHWNNLQIQADVLASRTLRELGEIGAGRLEPHELGDVSQRILVDIFDDGDRAKLVERFGQQGAEIVERNARQYAEASHKLNERFEQMLIERGVVRDQKKIAALEKRIEDLRSERDTEVKRIETQIDDARKIESESKGDGTLTARGARGTAQRLEESLDALKKQYDESIAPLKAELTHQRSLAEPLGRKYGHAHLYDRAYILQNREAFEADLLRVLAGRPDEDWLRSMQIESEDWGTLHVTDPDRYKAVLAQWAGDSHYHRLTVAQRALEAAELRQKRAELELADHAKRLRLIGREETRVKLSEARKLRDKLNAKVAAASAELEALRAERAAIISAADAARARTAARADQLDELLDGPRSPDVGERETEALDRALKGEDRAAEAHFRNVSDALKDPASAGRIENAGDVAKSGARLEAAQARADDAAATLRGPLEAPKALDVEATPRLAQLEERARRNADALARAERRVKRLQDRLAQTTELHDRADAMLKATRASRAELDRAVEFAQKQLGQSTKNVNELRRLLAKTEKGTPLDQAVTKIVEAIIDRNRIPDGIFDRVVKESARMKARRIDYTPDELREFMEKGWLRSDLANIQALQYEQLAGHLAVREALDIGRGARFESFEDVLRFMRQDYDALMQAAPDARAKRALEKERLSAEKDARGLYDRIIGATNPGIERDGWTYWISKKMRQLNVMRYGAGFGMSSLTDAGTFSLRHSMSDALTKFAGEAWKIIRGAASENPDELLAFANSTEVGAAGALLRRRIDTEQALDRAGIGVRGSLTQRVTGAIDLYGEKLANSALVFGGQPLWNRFWKITAALMAARDIRVKTAKYDSLSDFERADLATLGIGRAQAERLNRFITKYGEEAEGRFDPNLDEWLQEAGGADAVRDFRFAVTRDIERSINTAGIGDTPLAMDKWYGQLLGQFMTFAFTFVNRYATPLSQRMRVNGPADVQAIMSLAVLFGAATTVLMIKDAIRGKDPLERFQEQHLGQTMYDIVDRSGFLGYLSPFADSALKLSGLTAGTRYERNNWYESLLGVNGALLGDAARFTTSLRDIASGDTDANNVIRKGLILAPFNTYARLFHSLLGGSEQR